MAKKKKKGVQLKFDFFKDDRLPKLISVLSFFAAFYLLIAFVSYIFTWKLDQDKVLRFSWGLLSQGELSAANWLGRLGAIVSNGFFYWFFGIASFTVVYILGSLGFNLAKKNPFIGFWPKIRNASIFMLTMSVILGYIFHGAEFSYGGAVGNNIATWLVRFVGNIGTISLFIVVGLMSIIWSHNPDLEDLTFSKGLSSIKEFFADLWSGRYKQRKERLAAVAKNKRDIENLKTVETLKPKSATAKEDAIQDTPEKLEEGQLSLQIDETNIKAPTPLTVGNSTLEIEQPAATTAASGPTVYTPSSEIPSALQSQSKNHTEPYDPTLELANYKSPSPELLVDFSTSEIAIDRAELEANKNHIIETLLHYKIEIIKIKATIGPTVTLYEIVPAPGVRISKIRNLEDDIALSLSALGIRIIAPIPGKGTIGIEVPNKKKQTVGLREILESPQFQNAKMDLPIALGKTISNEVFVADLAKMPHLLIAGATGQGKSVGINTIITSLLYKKHPSQIKLVLIDPKKVELFPYAKLANHFLAYLPDQDEPIVTETSKVVNTLNSLIIEMEERYDLLKKAKSRNIQEYNDKFVARQLNPLNGHKFMPFIVLVIDEFADLIMTAGKEVELPIGRLAQLSRAVGIHLIIATQRPSVNIITGVIKANFPARMAFRVTAKVDSRTIIDTGGADRLVGRGDMLLAFGSDLIRLQCAFIDTPELDRVIDDISNQQGYPIPFFLPEFIGDDEKSTSRGFNVSDLDENFYDAARLIVQNQHGSTSMIQRRMRLGYNRAGRIMDQLEALGIVGPSEGSKAREVLIFTEVELEQFLKDLKTRK